MGNPSGVKPRRAAILALEYRPSPNPTRGGCAAHRRCFTEKSTVVSWEGSSLFTNLRPTPDRPENHRVFRRLPRPRPAWRGLQLLLFVVLLLEESVVSADVPLNGRKQDLAFTREQVQAIAAAAYDRNLKELARHGGLDRDAALSRRVRRIAGRVIAQAILVKPEAAHWNWEVHVASTDRLEAYCMAGGKILISTAFIQKEALTDGELATLLAHETAHAIAEHVREQLSAVRRLDPAYARFSAADVVALMDWDLSVTLKLESLSRLQELEADDIGIVLAARAGFDPRAIIGFYRKLARLDRGKEIFFDTHGASDQREKTAEAFAAYAEPLYAATRAHRPVPQYVFH
jgi:predicted Zn-dependent protease